MFGGCADNAISDKKWWLIAGYQEHVNEVIIEHIRLSRSQILVLNCKSKWAENVSLIDNRKGRLMWVYNWDSILGYLLLFKNSRIRIYILNSERALFCGISISLLVHIRHFSLKKSNCKLTKHWNIKTRTLLLSNKVLSNYNAIYSLSASQGPGDKTRNTSTI